ncbi:MAG: nitroreductase [Chloroflexi bacterium]|nr:nitroreductase [Chloroflexota bacterium]
MDVIEAIKLRKSIRGFKPAPVSKEALSRILDTAVRSPSTMNMQPWEFTVIAGEVLEKVRRANVEMLEAGLPPNPDVPYPDTAGIYRERRVSLGIHLFELMGITREDKAKRMEWRKRGYRFFDAPAAIIISIDRSLDVPTAMFDIGTVTQTIALTALNYDLGTCIHYQGARYPDVLRKLAGIPESKRIIICISIGYPDPEFPANKVQSEREPYQNITTWCGI